MLSKFDVLYESLIKSNTQNYSTSDKINAAFSVASPAKLAELIVTGRIQPVETLDQEEFADRIKSIRQSYAQSPELFLRAVQLAIKLKNGNISDAEINEWADRQKYPTTLSVNAGYVADIIYDDKRENFRRFQWTMNNK